MYFMTILSCPVPLNTGSAQISQILLKSLPLNHIDKITQVSDVAHGPLVFMVIKFSLKLVLLGINNGSTLNMFNGYEAHFNCVCFSYPCYPGL
jgi:hypothetical protein